MPFASSKKQLTFKARLSAKHLLIEKWVFFAWRKKSHFHINSFAPSFWNRGLTAYPNKIPETIAGRISAPVPFSFLKWRIALLEWFWRSQVIQRQHSVTLRTSPDWPTERFHMTSCDSSPLYMVAFDWEIRNRTQNPKMDFTSEKSVLRVDFN